MISTPTWITSTSAEQYHLQNQDNYYQKEGDIGTWQGKGAEILACNTDQQHLNMINADRKFLLGKGVTRGLGCGGFPEKGAESAKESLQEIKQFQPIYVWLMIKKC